MSQIAIASLTRALEITGHIADLGTDVRDLQHDIRTALDSLRQQQPLLHDLDVHRKLMKAIGRFDSMSAAAAAWGVPRQTLFAVVNGDRPAPPRVLAALGLEKVPSGRRLYREVE